MDDSQSIELTFNGQIEPVRAILQNHLANLRDAPLRTLEGIFDDM